MKLQIKSGYIQVNLSRRNLTDLIAALDNPVDGTALLKDTPQGRLYVKAEENDVHYEGKTPGPGIRPPQDEAVPKVKIVC